MITFDPHEPAPVAVRWARAIVPFVLFFSYLAFRVYPATDGRIPIGEAAVAGLVLVGLVLVGFIALGDLVAPISARARHAAEPEDLELTATLAPVVTDIDAAIEAAVETSWPRSTGVLFDDTDRLYTHDYEAMHHTPARGFPAPDYPDQLDDLSWNAYAAGQHRAEVSGFWLVGDHGEGIELDQFGQRIGGGRHRAGA